MLAAQHEQHEQEQTPEPDNFTSILLHVNKELSKLGFPMLQGLKKESKHILGCIYSLLQQCQKDTLFRVDLQTRMNTLDTDNDQLNAQLEKVNTRFEHANKEISQLKNKLDALQDSLKQMQSKYNDTKVELKTVKSNFALTKSQYQHEMRKKSRDMEKLKERLNKSIQEQCTKVKMGMTLLNPLQKPISMGSMDKKENPDEQMYQIVVNNYEEREKEILVENQELKDFLHSLYNRLDIPQSEQETHLNEAVFKMPFELSKSTLEVVFDKAFQSVSSLVKPSTPMDTQVKSSTQIEQEWTKEKSKLESKCLALQSTIDEQNELMELLMKQESKPAQESLMQTDKMEIESQLQDLEHARQVLDQERKQFTEAAVRMGIERAHLQKEREELEEEKRQRETLSLLNQLPSTPHWMKQKLESKTSEPCSSESSTPFWMKRTAPNVEDGDVNSPLKSKISNDIFGSTPKGVVDSMSLDSLHIKSDEVFVESDTLAAVTPRNLNQTWSTSNTPRIKSALKKTVRIQEEAIF